MASASDGSSGNWLSRFAALILAIVAGIWLYEFAQTLPDFAGDLRIEKGVYQGPADTPIDEDNLDALQRRSLGQSF